jgi:hypothetical protein
VTAIPATDDETGERPTDPGIPRVSGGSERSERSELSERGAPERGLDPQRPETAQKIVLGVVLLLLMAGILGFIVQGVFQI